VGRRDDLPNDCAEILENLDDILDLRNAYVRVQDRIREYSVAGRPVPEALRRCERDLRTELTAQSQGR
jgi:hypothetical protein